MAEPPLPRRPRYVPIFDKPGRRYLLPTFGAVIVAFLALVTVFLGGQLLVRTADVANRGVVVQAHVVAARHGSRDDFVSVRLPAPVG